MLSCHCGPALSSPSLASRDLSGDPVCPKATVGGPRKQGRGAVRLDVFTRSELRRPLPDGTLAMSRADREPSGAAWLCRGLGGTLTWSCVPEWTERSCYLGSLPGLAPSRPNCWSASRWEQSCPPLVSQEVHFRAAAVMQSPWTADDQVQEAAPRPGMTAVRLSLSGGSCMGALCTPLCHLLCIPPGHTSCAHFLCTLCVAHFGD